MPLRNLLLIPIYCFCELNGIDGIVHLPSLGSSMHPVIARTLGARNVRVASAHNVEIDRAKRIDDAEKAA
jgi:hypothetical protein